LTEYTNKGTFPISRKTDSFISLPEVVMQMRKMTHSWLRLATWGVLILGVAGSGYTQSPELPHVHLLATGGTIAGGATGSLNADDFKKLIPELDRVAMLTVEDFSNIGSSRMKPELQFQLAGRVNELFGSQPGLSGIVITHGTDSLEETAFFLDLLTASDRPVIFAAAQRPPRMEDSDGPRNLLNAIRLAASSASREMGVLITLNDVIHAAREVRKEHSIALDAFRSSWVGPVGTLDSGRIYFFCKPLRRLTLSVSSIEPRINLITLVAGSDGHLVRAAMSSGAKGIVLEVFGRGNVPPKVMEAVKEAREKDVVVVFTTRTRGGRVVLNSAARELGVVSGEDLDGFKARMLLVAALGEVRDLKTLGTYFRKLSGEVKTVATEQN
jgi:L-asparaginase